MSLAPKIDEVRDVVLDFKPDLGFFTETFVIRSMTIILISLVTTLSHVIEPWTSMVASAFIFTIPSNSKGSINSKILILSLFGHGSGQEDYREGFLV